MLYITTFDLYVSHFSTTVYIQDETEEDLYPPVVENGALQYFGPSIEEGENYRPGGLAEQMLGDLVITHL